VASARLRWHATRALALEGRARRIARYWADDANSARVPTATVGDLIATATTGAFGGRATIMAGVNNLTDAGYVSSVYINGVSGRFYEPGLERNIFVGLSLAGGGD
jgi:outer membrane receptor protein involved in Fe transport